MKKILAILVGIFVVLGNLNTIFDTFGHLRDAGLTTSDKWFKIFEVASQIGIPALLIIFIWKYYSILEVFEKLKIDYKNYSNEKENIQNIKKFNDQFLEDHKINIKYNILTLRILRDYFLSKIQTSDEKKDFAKFLYHNNINILDQKTYGIDPEVTKLVEKMYYEDKLKETR